MFMYIITYVFVFIYIVNMFVLLYPERGSIESNKSYKILHLFLPKQSQYTLLSIILAKGRILRYTFCKNIKHSTRVLRGRICRYTLLPTHKQETLA